MLVLTLNKLYSKHLFEQDFSSMKAVVGYNVMQYVPYIYKYDIKTENWTNKVVVLSTLSEVKVKLSSCLIKNQPMNTGELRYSFTNY
jgi:hypothetical protein